MCDALTIHLLGEGPPGSYPSMRCATWAWRFEYNKQVNVFRIGDSIPKLEDLRPLP